MNFREIEDLKFSIYCSPWFQIYVLPNSWVKPLGSLNFRDMGTEAYTE